MKLPRAEIRLFVMGLGIVIAGCGVAAPSGVQTPSIAPSPIRTATAPATASPTLTATPPPDHPEPFPTEAFADIGEGLSPTTWRLVSAALTTWPLERDHTPVMIQCRWSRRGEAYDSRRRGRSHSHRQRDHVDRCRSVLLGESSSFPGPASHDTCPRLRLRTNGATIRQLLSHRSGTRLVLRGEEAEFATNLTRYANAAVLALATPSSSGGSTFDTRYEYTFSARDRTRSPATVVAVLRDAPPRQWTERSYHPPAAVAHGQPRGSHRRVREGRCLPPSLSDRAAGPGAASRPTRSLAGVAGSARRIVRIPPCEMSTFAGGLTAMGWCCSTVVRLGHARIGTPAQLRLLVVGGLLPGTAFSCRLTNSGFTTSCAALRCVAARVVSNGGTQETTQRPYHRGRAVLTTRVDPAPTGRVRKGGCRLSSGLRQKTSAVSELGAPATNVPSPGTPDRQAPRPRAN